MGSEGKKQNNAKEAVKLIWKAMNLLGKQRTEDCDTYAHMPESKAYGKEGVALQERVQRIGNQLAALRVIARDLEKIR